MRRICPQCGELVDRGATCPCRLAKRKEADQQRGSAASRGYDAEWQALRRLWLEANPMCVLCGKPAKHVDHVLSIKQRPDLRLDPANLRSLCHSCHSRHTAKTMAFGR